MTSDILNRKESNYYDEYAKFNETSSKDAKANGAKPV